MTGAEALNLTIAVVLTFAVIVLLMWVFWRGPKENQKTPRDEVEEARMARRAAEHRAIAERRRVSQAQAALKVDTGLGLRPSRS